jgi:sugar O-acyltransferase (sialic acid O-acetyltransferase NeuD family)
MSYEVILPKLGANMREGTLERWYVKEGEQVEVGDPLFEMSTDKAVVDIEAEKKGVLKKILVEEGETVPIVTTIAVIADLDEDISMVIKDIENRKMTPSPEPIKPIKPEPESMKKAEIKKESLKAPSKHTTSYPLKAKASPKARALAEEAGIDLAKISLQPGKTIINVDDIQKYLEKTRKNCVIIGAGEYSSVIREILEMDETVDIAGYVDDNPAAAGSYSGDLPVLGDSQILSDLPGKGITHFIVSVGAPVFRARLFDKAVKAGLEPLSAIHPDSCVSKTAVIKPGSVVEAFSVVAVNSRIGQGVFVTQNCSVSHDCVLEDFCHLAPGCHLGGSVRVGRGALLGVGVSSAPHLVIGENTIVTPGSSIDHNIPGNGVVEGCPGKIIGKKSEKYRI